MVLPEQFTEIKLMPRLFWLLLFVSLSGCTRSLSTSLPENESQGLNNDCPAYETRNWRAWIEVSDDSTVTDRLHITGQIDLPSPGYSIDVSMGPLDRRIPPSLRVRIKPSPPDGMAIAVISSEDVQYAVDTTVLRYRSIIILCGDRQLAELLDVAATE